MTDDASLESQPPAPRVEESGPIAKIDKALPKGWRMRLAKAAAQLIAGSERGAVAYGEIRERLDTIEGRSLVSKKIAEAVAQQALDDPEIMERAKARFLGSTLQKQENLEAVIAGAAQPLLALPPPVQQQDAASAQTDPNGPDVDHESPSEPLNADWAATFTSLAENATTDELRSRLSRVLAGELKAPGTYSRSTIRQIAELEKSDLEAMQSVLNLVIGDMILRFGFGENQEPAIDKLLPLLEAGLVAEAGNMLTKTWPPASADDTQIWFGGRSSIIRVTLKVGQSFSVPMTQLTRTGVAVVDLLGRFDEEPILLRFVDSLDPSAFERVEIGRLIDANRVSLPLRLVRPLPAPTNIVTSGPFRFSP